MNWYQSQSHFFVVFLVIAVMALTAIPAMKKSFAKTSDNFIIHEMKRVQSEMYFYKIEHNGFKHACLSGDVSMLVSDVLYELGSGLSCVTSVDVQNIALYTTLHSEKIFCVDSKGYSGFIENKLPRGHCSK
ncbi:MAG: hypothetical protein LR005_01145 [Candidatus Pacebacteria bacterium]|nr:hypothetical protein [Candidatus Paceibacterota bacterium]